MTCFSGYTIYAKNLPKKCRQLANIVSDLKKVFKLMIREDLGLFKLVAHNGCAKVCAMKRVMAKFGAYTAHHCRFISKIC